MPAGAKEERELLLDGPLVRVEWLHASGLTRERMPEVHSPEGQLLFPLAGVFNWHLGSSTTLVDANKLLLIAPGDVSQDSHPASGDAGCLLLTPGERLVRENPASANWFGKRVVPLDPRLQRAAAMLAVAGRGGRASAEDIEEAAVHLLDRVAVEPPVHSPGNGSRRLVAAVREMLATHEERLSLAEIAKRLDVSPAYLTDAFRRSEGMPIAKYHRRLRLARTLIELPRTTDITALALGAGFSSHAHFSSAFKALYRETPSAFRRATRSRKITRLIERF